MMRSNTLPQRSPGRVLFHWLEIGEAPPWGTVPLPEARASDVAKP